MIVGRLLSIKYQCVYVYIHIYSTYAYVCVYIHI